MDATRYYVESTFRCLTDDEVGQMQHLMVDLGQPVTRVAARFNVSSATAYKVRKAVPEHMIAIRQPRRRRSA